jgi:hypothetical protein
MSPRGTHTLHERRDLEHLSPIVFVSFKRGCLGRKLGPALQATGTVEDRAADCLRPAQAGRLKLS